MDVMFEKCCGADVHKDSVVACVVKGPKGPGFSREVRTFGTTTRDLLKFRDWLEQEGVTHVAIESTGVYWKPVYNVLEGSAEVWLINAQHVKVLPGRKTDVKDSEWLADLLRHGLVRASFVPEMETRDLRELTRYRAQMVGERASEVNRVQKALESANLKLGSVLSDVVGVSGRAILDAIVSGETDPQKLANLAVKKVVNRKKDDLILALEGRIRPHHRFMLKMILEHIDELDAHIEEATREIEGRLGPFEEPIRRLDEIPGIGQRAAQVILAEIGTDMTRFPSADHLASWAGICPGNKASGGKRLSGKTRKGTPWLRSVLVESAWAAVRVKRSYFNAQYVRLKKRLGAKKAVVAVAHSILVVIYTLLKKGTVYKDLGTQHFEEADRQRLARGLKRRIESLGYQVTLEDKTRVA